MSANLALRLVKHAWTTEKLVTNSNAANARKTSHLCTLRPQLVWKTAALVTINLTRIKTATNAASLATIALATSSTAQNATLNLQKRVSSPRKSK